MTYLKGTLLLLFTLLVAWFRLSDAYDAQFNAAPPLVLVAHWMARFVFSGFLLLIFAGLGAFALQRLKIAPMEGLEGWIIACLTGLILLRVGGLAVGLLGGYQIWIMLPVAWLGLWYTPLKLRRMAGPKAYSEQVLVTLAGLLLVFAAGAVIALKIAYPLADSDYYGHYLFNYEEVATTGSLLPGSVWCHFFTSKGGSEIFFARQLSDPLAPFNVNIALFVLILAMVISLVRQMTGDSLSALIAATISCLPFLDIQPGVAEFCKQHLSGAVVLLGMVWLSFHHLKTQRLALPLLLHCVALAIFRPAFGAIAGCYLLIIWAVYRRSEAGRAHLIATLATGATILFMLGLNYVLTGLADITPFLIFYKFGSQEIFSRWGSPYLLLLKDLGSSSGLGGVAMPGITRFFFAWRVLRMDEFGLYLQLSGLPYLLLAVLAGVALWGRGQDNIALKNGLLCLLGLFIAATVACLFIRQDDSLKRAYLFGVFLMACFGALPIGAARSLYRGTWLATLAGIIACVIAGLALDEKIAFMPNRHLHAAAQFYEGKRSLSDIFTEEKVYHPQLVTACQQVPQGTIVYTSRQVYSPDCKIRNFFSFLMGRNWHDMLFASPAEAAAALKAEGYEYFFLDLNEPFFDILPYAPIFHPQNLSRFFGLVWQQDGYYLLTFKENTPAALPPEFFPAYIKSVQKTAEKVNFGEIHRILAGIYEPWNKSGRKWPVKLPENVTYPKGWQ